VGKNTLLAIGVIAAAVFFFNLEVKRSDARGYERGFAKASADMAASSAAAARDRNSAIAQLEHTRKALTAALAANRDWSSPSIDPDVMRLLND